MNGYSLRELFRNSSMHTPVSWIHVSLGWWRMEKEALRTGEKHHYQLEETKMMYDCGDGNIGGCTRL